MKRTRTLLLAIAALLISAALAVLSRGSGQPAGAAEEGMSAEGPACTIDEPMAVCPVE